MTSPSCKDDFYVPLSKVLRDLGGSATHEATEEKASSCLQKGAGSQLTH